MNDAIRIEVPGKWVLAGEHAVLRRGIAVATVKTEKRDGDDGGSERKKGTAIRHD